jgi:predicted phosphodiesterase
MKVAVISDIHANLVAFRRVLADLAAWQPDIVVVAGDTVKRGPRPREGLEIVLEKQRTEGWLVVRGNHEDYVIDQGNPQAPSSGPVYETHQASYWTYQKLGKNVADLVQMPFQVSFPGPDGREFRVAHASMTGNRHGIYPETGEMQLRSLIGPADKTPAVFVVGHTHRPLIRQVGETFVVNAGSAGLPFDGCTRPSYARLEWLGESWKAQIQRLEYDLAQAERDFFESGYAAGAGPLTDLVLIELRSARSQLYYWAISYQEQVMAGEMSMRASIDAYLKSNAPGLPPQTGAAGEPRLGQG